MERPDPDGMRRLAVVCGLASTVITGIGVLLFYTVPGFPPVGLPVAVLLSTAILTQPIWAAALAYTLHTGTALVDEPHGRRLRNGAVAALTFQLVGFVLSLPRMAAPLGATGDLLYGVGTIILLFLSAAIAVLPRW